MSSRFCREHPDLLKRLCFLKRRAELKGGGGFNCQLPAVKEEDSKAEDENSCTDSSQTSSLSSYGRCVEQWPDRVSTLLGDQPVSASLRCKLLTEIITVHGRDKYRLVNCYEVWSMVTTNDDKRARAYLQKVLPSQQQLVVIPVHNSFRNGVLTDSGHFTLQILELNGDTLYSNTFDSFGKSKSIHNDSFSSSLALKVGRELDVVVFDQNWATDFEQAADASCAWHCVWQMMSLIKDDGCLVAVALLLLLLHCRCCLPLLLPLIYSSWSSRQD